jgi:hypothetical protein
MPGKEPILILTHDAGHREEWYLVEGANNISVKGYYPRNFPCYEEHVMKAAEALRQYALLTSGTEGWKVESDLGWHSFVEELDILPPETKPTPSIPEPFLVTIPVQLSLVNPPEEEEVTKGRKWIHAKLVLKLPDGWRLDYYWTGSGMMPIISGQVDGTIRFGVRKSVYDNTP